MTRWLLGFGVVVGIAGSMPEDFGLAISPFGVRGPLGLAGLGINQMRCCGQVLAAGSDGANARLDTPPS